VAPPAGAPPVAARPEAATAPAPPVGAPGAGTTPATGGNDAADSGPGKVAPPPPERPETAAGQPRAPFLGDADDLLSDVDGEIDENAFKW
jgi:hypothetical protein